MQEKNIKSYLLTGLAGILTLTLTGVLYGWFKPVIPLPAIGKLLHPSHGVWNSEQPDLAVGPIEILDQEATIVYDDRGVPHIYASNLLDALRLQGYVEARDRAFQLDFTHRAASGRLSEVIGKATLAMDKETRKNGMPRAAAKSLADIKNQPGYAYAEAYVEGINAYLNALTEKSLPLECKLLGYKPQLWTPQHVLDIRVYMSDYLNGYGDDVAATNMLSILGDSLYHDLYPLTNPNIYPITNGTNYEALASFSATPTNDISKDTFVHRYYRQAEGVGSNNWAVNARKTANGHPIYCSDPHLSLSLPSIWYEMQIHTPEFHVHGVKIVGIPGLMMGFNEHIAWGETNVGHDQKDFFKVKWMDKTKGIYELDGQPTNATYWIDTILVKDQKPIVDTTIVTYWGPIVHESSDGKNDLAMQWKIAFGSPKDELQTFVKLMGAKGNHDHQMAINDYVDPPQNFAMASSDDTVAIRIGGLLPIRSQGDGIFVENGNLTNNGYKAFIPANMNPAIVNPEAGFVTSSNQQSTDESYPFFYHGNFSDYRNLRLQEKLSAQTNFTTEDMKALQNDTYSPFAASILPYLVEVVDSKTNNTPESIKVIDQLKAWDFHYNTSEVAPAIFEQFWKILYAKIYDEILPIEEDMMIKYPEKWRTVELLKSNLNHPIFDVQGTAVLENAHSIISAAFDSLVVANTATPVKTWGESKPTHIHHLTRIPGFGRKNIKADGCLNCINANNGGFGPSWRMVVELDERPRGFGIFPGGQNGDPRHHLYDTGVEKWSKGEYFELALMHKDEATQHKDWTTSHFKPSKQMK